MLLATLLFVAGAVQEQSNLTQVQPEVHSVTVSETHVEIRSAGISTRYFGPLQSPPMPPEKARQFRFLIPRNPRPDAGSHAAVRPGITGVFVNGVPIYNQLETLSYRGQNLWHFDLIAGGDDGGRVAAGRPRPELRHNSPLGLLEEMIDDTSRHSPIIGFALDGYPVYGPWGHAEPDGGGGLKRMSSSYRLRRIRQRTQWPDGTVLTASQEEPDVGPEFPLGTFIEDYEYVAGSGDLDRHNGRFARTPEYPDGTYAYFLSTDAAGRLAFPYLIGSRYYGEAAPEELDAAVQEGPFEKNAPASKELIFDFFDSEGNSIRHLEYVHERPVHLIVVSEDLNEFDHIHPVLAAGNRYRIAHVFPSPGKYRLFADVTLPGGEAHVEARDFHIEGQAPERVPLIPDEVLEKSVGPVRVSLAASELRAGQDAHFMLSISSPDLQPYLGAWAHFMIVDENARGLIHAHAMGMEATISANHEHGTAADPAATPPSSIHATARLPIAGLHKMWIQFQVAGKVLTVSFVLRVQ